MDYSTELKQRERQQGIIFKKHFSEIVAITGAHILRSVAK